MFENYTFICSSKKSAPWGTERRFDKWWSMLDCLHWILSAVDLDVMMSITTGFIHVYYWLVLYIYHSRVLIKLGKLSFLGTWEPKIFLSYRSDVSSHWSRTNAEMTRMTDPCGPRKPSKNSTSTGAATWVHHSCTLNGWMASVCSIDMTRYDGIWRKKKKKYIYTRTYVCVYKCAYIYIIIYTYMLCICIYIYIYVHTV